MWWLGFVFGIVYGVIGFLNILAFVTLWWVDGDDHHAGLFFFCWKDMQSTNPAVDPTLTVFNGVCIGWLRLYDLVQLDGEDNVCVSQQLLDSEEMSERLADTLRDHGAVVQAEVRQRILWPESLVAYFCRDAGLDAARAVGIVAVLAVLVAVVLNWAACIGAQQPFAGGIGLLIAMLCAALTTLVAGLALNDLTDFSPTTDDLEELAPVGTAVPQRWENFTSFSWSWSFGLYIAMVVLMLVAGCFVLPFKGQRDSLTRKAHR